MDKFVSKKAKGDISHKSSKTAKDRAREFPGIYYEDDGRLFCSLCNLVVDHTRKSTIERHIKSERHVQKQQEKYKEKEPEAGPSKKQKTMTSTLRAVTVADQSRIKNNTGLGSGVCIWKYSAL